MVYTVVRAIVRFLFLLLGLKIEGLHKLPQKGPVIIASNHVSNWDPVVVAISVNRPVHFMAKAELFENRFLSVLLKSLHAFPVKRGTADRAALKYALHVLNHNMVLGIFPEGGRNRTGEEMKAQGGTAMIALKSGAAVVPIACIGTRKILPVGWFKPLVVRIGEPVDIEEFRDQKVNSALMDAVSQKIMNEINALLTN